MLFYKITFSYQCTPLIRLLKKFFTKLNFHSCVHPLERLFKKFFYKIKFSYQYRYSSMNFLFFVFWTLLPRLLVSNSSLYTTLGNQSESSITSPESNTLGSQSESSITSHESSRLGLGTLLRSRLAIAYLNT